MPRGVLRALSRCHDLHLGPGAGCCVAAHRGHADRGLGPEPAPRDLSKIPYVPPAVPVFGGTFRPRWIRSDPVEQPLCRQGRAGAEGGAARLLYFYSDAICLGSVPRLLRPRAGKSAAADTHGDVPPPVAALGRGSRGAGPPLHRDLATRGGARPATLRA